MRFFAIGTLFMASVALASQLSSFDTLRFPYPLASNHTCNLEEDNLLVLASNYYQVCLSKNLNENVSTEPESESSSDYAPWTQPPSCLESFDGSRVFCIYTSSTFAHGRGISLFTTPSIAEHFAQSAAFVNPDVLEGVNVHNNPPYFSQSLPGRGIGLIINRTLHRGDTIFSHTPVLIVHRDTFEVFSEEDRFPFQRDAVNLLPESSRSLYLALHGHFGGDKVDDILHTNSFQVYIGEDEEAHNIVLPETSRMNHDCRPNAHYYFDLNTLTHHVHAVRTIQVGEELTISYIDGTNLHADRQEAIKLSWGFGCSCSLCSQREVFTNESDKRLQLIPHLHERLDNFSDSSVTPDIAETLISLYEQERLHSPIALGYAHAAVTYNSFKREQVALKYALLAIEYTLLNGGPDAPDMQEMSVLIENPRHHWSWGKRVPR